MTEPVPMLPLSVYPPGKRQPGGISVTLPSRKRPEMLRASVESLRSTATRPELLEFLVAYDPDDPETGRAADDLFCDVVWQAPERYGYAGTPRYYAELLNRATGEWTLPTWGDDGLMQTQGWDETVRAQPRGSVIWVAGNYPGLTCFPIVHMDVFFTLRRLCPLPALDTWYEYVGTDAGILVRPDPEIYVLQDRFDLTGNNRDLTYIEGRTGYRSAEFHGEPYTTWRAEDAFLLRTLA